MMKKCHFEDFHIADDWGAECTVCKKQFFGPVRASVLNGQQMMCDDRAGIRTPITASQQVLWHPSSPGATVPVKRNWLQRIFFPRDFATLGETIKSHKRARQSN